MARQILIPGNGFIDEVGEEEYLIPGVGFFNEAQPFTPPTAPLEGRQWLIPAYGNIHETGIDAYVLPNYGQFFERQPVVIVEQWHPSYGGGGVGKAQIIPSGESPPTSAQ